MKVTLKSDGSPVWGSLPASSSAGENSGSNNMGQADADAATAIMRVIGTTLSAALLILA